MDQYWYVFGCVVFGGVLGVVVPYLFKVMDDDIKFSYSYFYGLCVSMSISAIALVPATNPTMSAQMVMVLVMAGFGIQQGANFVTSKVRKGIVSLP